MMPIHDTLGDDDVGTPTIFAQFVSLMLVGIQQHEAVPGHVEGVKVGVDGQERQSPHRGTGRGLGKGGSNPQLEPSNRGNPPVWPSRSGRAEGQALFGRVLLADDQQHLTQAGNTDEEVTIGNLKLEQAGVDQHGEGSPDVVLTAWTMMTDGRAVNEENTSKTNDI
ncbi:hypothetical protein [Paramagnetospirillum magneticum]|uniref:hypothetical protein n=1 Tax=Paramagnetospirillum magneticum TaxID=84159 RepID=UPI0011D07862|nr:hypothetical protein [Paramagnetospirillum magneticum]